MSVILKHSTATIKHRLTWVMNYHGRFFNHPCCTCGSGVGGELGKPFQALIQCHNKDATTTPVQGALDSSAVQGPSVGHVHFLCVQGVFKSTVAILCAPGRLGAYLTTGTRQAPRWQWLFNHCYLRSNAHAGFSSHVRGTKNHLRWASATKYGASTSEDRKACLLPWTCWKMFVLQPSKTRCSR